MKAKAAICNHYRMEIRHLCYNCKTALGIKQARDMTAYFLNCNTLFDLT